MPTRLRVLAVTTSALVVALVLATSASAQDQIDTDLAEAILPDQIEWVATKEATIIEPPYGLIPLEVGVMFDGLLPVATTCEGATCTQASAIDLWPQTPYTPVPEIAWVHDGSQWTLDGQGHHVSASYSDGTTCVYLRTDTWDVTVTDAVHDGTNLVATRLEGTMERGDQLDTGASVGNLDSCPPYQAIDLWSIVGTAEVTPPPPPPPEPEPTDIAVDDTEPDATAPEPVEPRVAPVSGGDGGSSVPVTAIVVGLILVSLIAIFLATNSRRRHRPDQPWEPPLGPPPVPPPPLEPEPEEHHPACDWEMYLVDGSSPGNDNILTVLKEARPGASPCCKYYVKVHTTVPESTADGSPRERWFTTDELERAMETFHHGPTSPLFAHELVIHETRKRSQVLANGAGLSAMAAIANTAEEVEPMREVASGSEDVAQFVRRRADDEGTMRPDHWFDSDCERHEETLIEVHLERGCRADPSDHVFESRGESRVRYRSRLSCHEPHPRRCESSMSAEETGEASVSGDLNYTADKVERTSEARTTGASGWKVKKFGGGVGPLELDSDGGIAIDAGVGKLELELELPADGDHEQTPPELALSGGTGVVAKTDKFYSVRLNSKLEDKVSANVDSSLTAIAETEIEHHIRLRGSTRLTPGMGEACGCGEAECDYCRCGFTLLIGTQLETIEPGETRTTRDPVAALDLAWQPHGDEAEAHGMILVGGRTWLLTRPPGAAGGNWVATRSTAGAAVGAGSGAAAGRG